jgi:hypothetical protein
MHSRSVISFTAVIDTGASDDRSLDREAGKVLAWLKADT